MVNPYFLGFIGGSGALAVGMAGYGFHKLQSKQRILHNVFLFGNLFHFIHTLALISIPLTNFPVMSFWMLASGMILSSGSCYYHGITTDNSYAWLTHVGAFLLIIGWLSIGFQPMLS